MPLFRSSHDSTAPLAGGGRAWPAAAHYYPEQPAIGHDVYDAGAYDQKRHRHHWWYVWVPLFTAFIWFGSLLAMLVVWLVRGRPFYDSMSPGQKIAYISDIGATHDLRPLFIAAASVTGMGLFVSLVLERWLRHTGRLHPHLRRREQVLAALSILSAAIGAAALILLSVYDTRRYMTLHRVFLLFFVLGVGFSAIFTVVEFRWIERSYPYAQQLRTAYKMKGVLVLILIPAAIAFGVCLGRNQDVAACLEWAIAFGFNLYLITFWMDLRHSGKRSVGELRRENIHTSQVAPHVRERLANGNSVTV